MPGVTLKVYSSMTVYSVAETEDAERFGTLYCLCRETEGGEYVGSVPQPRLAEELRQTAVLAYPNTFTETSYIAVLEPLAAGCRIVTSALGAPPETTAGFGRLIPVDGDPVGYSDRFVAETVAVLRQFAEPDVASLEGQLHQQVAHMNEYAGWPVLAKSWVEWLSGRMNGPLLFR